MIDIKEKVKILIADDHLVACKGLEYVIRPIFENPFFHHINTLCQLISEIQNEKFDLLLLDVNYKDGSLTDKIAQIKETLPDSKILIFTSGISFKDFNFLKRYVDAILSKQSNLEDFERIIKSMLSKDSFLHSPLKHDKIVKMNLLTERELQVIQCMLEGMCNKEIVSVLDIKESTISTLRKRALEKLDLENNVELLNYFIESVF